jgi:hypothetical protein
VEFGVEKIGEYRRAVRVPRRVFLAPMPCGQEIQLRGGGSASHSRMDPAAGEKDGVSTPAIICLYSPEQGASQAGEGCNQDRISSPQYWGGPPLCAPREHQRDGGE